MIINAKIIIIILSFVTAILVNIKQHGKEEANKQWGKYMSSFRIYKLLLYSKQVKLGF